MAGQNTHSDGLGHFCVLFFSTYMVKILIPCVQYFLHVFSVHTWTLMSQALIKLW